MPEDVITQAADIIAPHLTARHRRRDFAVGNAEDLHDAGLLAGGTPRTRCALPVAEQAVNVLQCRQPWSVAEQIAADLDKAGLLRADR